MSEYKDYGYSNTGVTHAHSYILNPLFAMLDSEKNKNILDLGCGNGAIVNTLVARGLNAFGTDASPSGIEQAKLVNSDRFALQDLNRDALPPEFSDIPFDTIIATELIEHLYAPRDFVKYCRKILLDNGGGYIILSTPYHGYLKNLALALFNKWDEHANPLWDGGHIKLWSYKTLCALLEEAGFQVVDFKGCGRFPYLWKSMLIKARIEA